MGKDAGMLRYMIKAPVACPWNYVKHGGGWAAFVSPVEATGDSSQPFFDAFVAYLLAKILPPITPVDITTTLILGAVSAGLLWRLNSGF